MSITTLSNTLIEQKKAETLNAQALRKSVPMRDINLIDEKTIEFKGARIEITESAFKSLLSLVGMSNAFATKFEKLFTPEAKSQFINRMKDAMASNGGSLNEVVLTLVPKIGKIVAFSKPGKFGIGNQQFMDVSERLIDKHNLQVTDWSVNPNTGLVQIDVFNPNAEFAIGGLQDEVFTGGLSLQNSPLKGFQVSPYVNRMWCTNGLTTRAAAETYTLHSLDNDSVNKFFEHIHNIEKNSFAPEGFGDRVRASYNTPASIAEMEYAHNLIKPFAGERTDNWVPLQENLNAYAKAGFENMNHAQKRQAKTNTSVYDVLNGVTHFSTHGAGIIDTNMQNYNAMDINVRIGDKLFGKQAFDHENSMPDVFKRNELVRHGSLLN